MFGARLSVGAVHLLFLSAYFSLLRSRGFANNIACLVTLLSPCGCAIIKWRDRCPHPPCCRSTDLGRSLVPGCHALLWTGVICCVSDPCGR